MRAVKNEVSVATANVTLTTASPAMIIVTNATAVVTLQNATTAGNGTIQHIVNAAGSGNVSVPSASLIGGDASINATAQAAEATKTAESTLFAMQVADLNFQRASNQTQVALDLDRKELTNTALAFAPYLLAMFILTPLACIIVRFGQVEVNLLKLN